MNGFICGPRIYEYEGWIFEHGHYICWPLKKDGEPRKRAGRKFYDMVGRFVALSEEEQEKHRVGGGCIRMGGNDEWQSRTDD